MDKSEGFFWPSATTLRQDETVPAAYPALPSNLSAKATAIYLGEDSPTPATDALWQRIESYIAHRFTSRVVVWIVEGPGDWWPPLTKVVSINAVERWEPAEAGWVESELAPSPLGHQLSDGAHRITATVGEEPTPAVVTEAFRRLAEYSVEIGADSILTGHPSHSSHSLDLGNSVQENFERSPTWAARAMQLSGAADLLRPYRRG